MPVHNVHERLLTATPEQVGALIDSLATGPADRLWPHRTWTPMAFDGPVVHGASGGHGPVRYTVAAHVPGTWVRFAFTAPRGFHGFHEYAALPVDAEHTVLRHTLSMRITGLARLSWPLGYRWMHDALLEDSLDLAERACHGRLPHPARWSAYVRLLYRLFPEEGTTPDPEPAQAPASR
ncbi:SRPBCC family protein [Streptomyces sp. RerS4]|uniref:SRPBCC family protein n=1 Tax=Streptomyces sp. RerS4 TaxID=2942449 RepID=UPI00201BBF1C|nr:SRPBCC family protein [Streptomyces sp. RerS4]UQX00741.1 SRPBCC family protein [Streptomyces sp. RerS4]